MKEKIMIDAAIDALEKQTAIKALYEKGTQTEIDGILKFTYNTRAYKFNIEVKKELRNYQLPELEKLNIKYQPLIVIAEYIFPKIKDELRKLHIAYLETNGNTYITEKDLILWVERQKTTPATLDKKGRAFTKTGLKLVFQFMLQNDLINLTYREMADRTGVGFGNINFIIQDLKEQGFLIKLNKDQYQLARKKDLLKKWMEAYQAKLKPGLLIGNFRFFNNDDLLNWKKLPLRNMETWWGGEPAGDLFTNHLRPEEYTLYTTEKKADLIRHYRLLPDDKGPVHVYQKFWQYDEVNIDVAPPLLVYTDLMNTGDRRCIETAEKIYNDFLQDKF